jgi:hypothetical protein
MDIAEPLLECWEAVQKATGRESGHAADMELTTRVLMKLSGCISYHPEGAMKLPRKLLPMLS